MKKPVISAFVLIAYCAILIKVMVFKDIPTISVGSLMLNFAGTRRRHQTLTLMDRTTIRTSAGPAAAGDLKVGDRVTVVVYDGETATTVLLCSE